MRYLCNPRRAGDHPAGRAISAFFAGPSATLEQARHFPAPRFYYRWYDPNTVEGGPEALDGTAVHDPDRVWNRIPYDVPPPDHRPGAGIFQSCRPREAGGTVHRREEVSILSRRHRSNRLLKAHDLNPSPAPAYVCDQGRRERVQGQGPHAINQALGRQTSLTLIDHAPGGWYYLPRPCWDGLLARYRHRGPGGSSLCRPYVRR